MKLPELLCTLTVLALAMGLHMLRVGHTQLMAKRSIRHSWFSHEARLQIALDETEETAELDRLLTFQRR